MPIPNKSNGIETKVTRCEERIRALENANLPVRVGKLEVKSGILTAKIGGVVLLATVVGGVIVQIVIAKMM